MFGNGILLMNKIYVGAYCIRPLFGKILQATVQVVTCSLLFFSSLPVYAENVSNDLVDLNEKYWAYKDTKNLVDHYDFIKLFPDHTFRGFKPVNRYEISVTALKMIKYLEEIKKTNFEPGKEILANYREIPLTDIPKNHWASTTVKELKDNYKIILSPEINKFEGNKNISRYELAYMLNQIILLMPKKDMGLENPYEDKSPEPVKLAPKKSDLKKWAEDSVKNILDNKIMSDFGKENDFNGNQEINRYQLASAIIKTMEYIKKMK
jgi:hypothetical protein